MFSKNIYVFKNKLRGHSKSTLARNFQYLAPPPFSFLFVLHVPQPHPPSTYVRFCELPPPFQKKLRDAYDAYFE